MPKNVGTVDALLRITLGFLGVAWGISRLSRFRYQPGALFLTALSSMKIAEGITRFCPMLAMFDMSTRDDQNEDNTSNNIKNFSMRNIRRSKNLG